MTKIGDEVIVKSSGLGYPSKAEILAIDGDDVTVRMKATGRRKVVPSSKIHNFRGEAETVVPPATKPRAERRIEVARERVLDMLAEPPPRATLRPIPKPKKPARSARYLDFVREKPCCSCSAPGPSDPHHVGRRGMGQKTDDFRTTPHCRRCHDHYHDHGALPGMNAAATKTFILARQVDLLVEFLRCELESP